MAEQLSLPGFDDVLGATDRLFFAILPDEIAAQRIALLARHLRSKYRLQGRQFARTTCMCRYIT
jgi:hypothetical protein